MTESSWKVGEYRGNQEHSWESWLIDISRGWEERSNEWQNLSKTVRVEKRRRQLTWRTWSLRRHCTESQQNLNF